MSSHEARFRPRLRGPAALALALSLGAGSVAPLEAQRISNPDLYRKSLRAATQAGKQYGIVETDPEVERVNRIGYELAAVSDFDKFPFTFSVVDMSIPNAFALPGGHIFVTRGLLDLGLDDDMLASLLGHEIAHVTQQHFLRMQRRATLFNALSQLLTIGMIAAQSSSRDEIYQGPGGIWQRDSSNTADLLQGAQATSLVMSELLLRSYSRDNEDESDEVGQRLSAKAGYSPDGARQLMAKMRARIPQTKAFGYWQTHPFFDDRVRAAEARAQTLAVLGAPSREALDSYRQGTQTALLGFLETTEKLEEDARETLKTSALLAWPAGPAADGIRVERLERLRTETEQRLSLSRDYGALVTAYLEQMRQISALTPESPALERLRRELGGIRSELSRLYPAAIEVLDRGVYETSFLESYLSNYPDSPRRHEAAVALGLAYSRLGRETEAVDRLVRVWESAPESEAGQQAALGLRNLAPLLRQLGALELLAGQERDEELAALAERRLDEFSKRFTELSNGADYLRRFPDGDHAEIVTNRLHDLAENAYREMVLYQQLGDVAKAIDRANQILEHAPLSPAAERLGRELEEEGVTGG
ncbi:MAG TPA: M48 family metalloprotease [Thermoanaerobaculia bacterium]|nr:M48 family metalloprotease [Thermoanaerobaculia bacterium]